MLNVISLNDAKKWDEIVKSFQDHDIYFLNAYVKSFYLHGDGEPLLFFYEDDKCRGINVVFKRDIHNDPRLSDAVKENEYYDLTSPYGYGGWIIEGNDYSSLFKEYEQWCSANKIVCEFVRFHPLINNQEYSVNNYDVIALGKVIAMDCSDSEKLWSNMSSRNRNKIKKAMKSGVSVERCGKEKLDDFIRIYEETMDRDNASDYYYFRREYYDCLFDELKDKVCIFYSKLDDQMLSNCIVFMENGRMSYHLAGSTRTSGNIYETNLLIYEAAKWGNENGYKSFLLGGGVGSSEDHLYQFKKGFDDKNAYQFYIGKKIYLKEIYDKLVAERKDIKNPAFFPMYRG